ncbi:MAG: hypothetical protein CFE22_10320 [Cytophagaceae bacterium BCCC1]|nr:MAG: hypothetical protein CFE22_10320 [Cytophagaceae bacterium BCCC1]
MATLQLDQIIVILIADLTMIITGLIIIIETLVATRLIYTVNTRIIQMVREIEVTTTAREEITEGKVIKLKTN